MNSALNLIVFCFLLVLKLLFLSRDNPFTNSQSKERIAGAILVPSNLLQSYTHTPIAGLMAKLVFMFWTARRSIAEQLALDGVALTY
jgi:hypothetical protein